MRYSILISSILLSTSLSYSQQLKKKSASDQLFRETYFIDKASKEKNGMYFSISYSNNDTLVKGYFGKNRRIGIWSFKSIQPIRNSKYLVYNYDTKKIVEYSDSLSLQDTFYIRDYNGNFTLSKVDSPPIFLGFKDQFKHSIALKVRIPTNIMERNLSGVSVFSMDITKEGLVGEVNVIRGFDRAFEDQILKIVKSIEGQWIPAYRDHQPVDSKIILYVSVQESLELDPNRSYLWYIPFMYASNISIKNYR